MLDFADMDLYKLLIRVCSEYAVDPSSSLEAETFFRQLLTQYSGTDDPATVAAWLREQVPKYFMAIDERPKWIQGAEWAFDEYGNPMIFAGQIDIDSVERKRFESLLFHDDTSLYVFIGRKVDPVVVMQQY